MGTEHKFVAYSGNQTAGMAVSLADAPVLFSASYYDHEQGLTDADVYAARVHDWHAVVDSLNRHYARTYANWRAGYRDWSDDWGPRPDLCPACGGTIGPGVFESSAL